MADMTAPGGATTVPPPGNGQPAQDTTSQVSDKAHEAAGQAKEKAQEATQKARSRVQDEVDKRSTEAGEKVSTTAGDLRSVGEQLRSQGKDAPAKIAEQAADRTERIGGYLRDADGDRILGDVEDFARRQPWVVVAGGLALGVAASRFLKASSSERYRTRQAAGNGAPSPQHDATPSAPPPYAVGETPGATLPPIPAAAPPAPTGPPTTVAPSPAAPPVAGGPPTGTPPSGVPPVPAPPYPGAPR
jgi:hypothetical protein